MKNYEAVIVGGGIAGLQAAIQLGRYQHQLLVIDSERGRSNLCRCYHNLLGWPDGVSGQHLRAIGRKQAVDLGVEFLHDTVSDILQERESFHIVTTDDINIRTKTVLFATGVVDRIPPVFAELYPCLGVSVFICPDCDGYEVKNKRTMVLGTGNPGANMALTLSYWTKDLTYINHELRDVDEQLKNELKERKITYIHQPVAFVLTEEDAVKGVILQNGQKIEAPYAFIAFGGNKVKSELAKGLGVELHQNSHILVDSRTKMTNVHGVWAAGDVVAHSEQVAIAMGDGLQAAIWMHKTIIGQAKNKTAH
ncbi:pyridine nucleotide-disulfide oxidoreductase [Thalassobacillus devorans]|uniref:Pyridine nucleotide-disulfide oxidoreductase n=1 Tax=Thalassobacillus devorans TaxID=279813 RepID=A0ABQ1PFW4_9BACI|nr:NAD(P)/FAD-dependent oxidoreductase [Thalassobacillus devorans]NIK29396.1 thioredoxin reductase [Thalassobacillus devorans]GGC96341.1 pyridine nucleotide-disulfide oxidoreductase [Thalassobacillus devorans]